VLIVSEKKKNISNPVVYIPEGVKINLKNENLPPPSVQYEKRRCCFPRDKVKDQITKRETP